MNVTFYTYYDFKTDFPETETFHFYRFPQFSEKDLPEIFKIEGSAVPAMMKWTNVVTNSLFNSKEGRD